MADPLDGLDAAGRAGDNPPSAWPPVALLLLLAASLGALLLGLGWAADGPLRVPDVAVDTALAAQRSPALTGLAEALTTAAQPAVGVAVGLLGPLGLWLAGRRGTAISLLACAGGALGVSYLTKDVITEPRPPAQLWAIAPDSVWSYPSGHTTVAGIVLVALVLVTSRRHRVLAAALGIVLVAAVGWARIYLGVHYPPDILGAVLATATATALIAAGAAAITGAARAGAGLPVRAAERPR